MALDGRPLQRGVPGHGAAGGRQRGRVGRHARHGQGPLLRRAAVARLDAQADGLLPGHREALLVGGADQAVGPVTGVLDGPLLVGRALRAALVVTLQRPEQGVVAVEVLLQDHARGERALQDEPAVRGRAQPPVLRGGAVSGIRLHGGPVGAHPATHVQIVDRTVRRPRRPELVHRSVDRGRHGRGRGHRLRRGGRGERDTPHPALRNRRGGSTGGRALLFVLELEVPFVGLPTQFLRIFREVRRADPDHAPCRTPEAEAVEVRDLRPVRLPEPNVGYLAPDLHGLAGQHLSGDVACVGCPHLPGRLHAAGWDGTDARPLVLAIGLKGELLGQVLLHHTHVPEVGHDRVDPALLVPGGVVVLPGEAGVQRGELPGHSVELARTDIARIGRGATVLITFDVSLQREILPSRGEADLEHCVRVHALGLRCLLGVRIVLAASVVETHPPEDLQRRRTVGVETRMETGERSWLHRVGGR